MADKNKTNTLSDTKSRFAAYQQSSETGSLHKFKSLVKSRQDEIAFGTCCVLAILTCGVFVSTSLGYIVAEQTNAHLADKKLDDTLQQLNMLLTVDPFSDAARFNRARVLGKMKKRKEAVNDLNIVLEHNPNNIEALEHRSAQLIVLGEYEKALADCNKLVDLQKEHASVFTYANRAIASAMLGKNDAAIEDYSSAIRIKPKDPLFFLGRANVYREMHKYSEAIEDLEWVAMLSPGNVEGLVMQSQIYAAQKNDTKALAKLNEGIKANPTSSKLYFERSKFLWARTHSKEALADLSKAIQFDPKNNDALLESMRVNTGLHNDKEALKAANLLVMNNFSNYEVQMTRANLEMAEKRYGIAELGYQCAAELKPQEIAPLVGGARVLAEQNKFQQASNLLSKALSIKPADPALLISRADYERRAKQFDRAEADYEKAIGLKSDNTDAHMGLGMNYCDQGNYKRAAVEFETVLRAKPKAADALNFLAFAKRGMTNFGKLRATSSDVVASSSAPTASSSSSDPKVKALVATGSFDEVFKAGVARYSSGSYNAAINLLSQAVKLNPNATAARRYLAKALIAGGYNSDGISQYRTVISQEPGNVDDLTTLANASVNSRQYEDAIESYEKLLQAKPHDVDATCGLISAYKGAGMTRKAQEICKDAIRSANGLREVSRYESLMNSMSGTTRVTPKPGRVPLNPQSVDGLQG